MPRIDEERWERLQMISDRVERLRDFTPSEEFDLETAKMIARVEVNGGQVKPRKPKKYLCIVHQSFGNVPCPVCAAREKGGK